MKEENVVFIFDENSEDIESKILKIFEEYIEKWADKYYC